MVDQYTPETTYQYTVERTLLRQVAQSRPTGTAVVSVYSPGDGVQAVVKRIIICNTSAGAAAFDLYHDDDGTTYDQTTQLYHSETLTASTTRVLEDELYVDSTGNIAVRSDVTSAITFSLYAEEAQIRAR